MRRPGFEGGIAALRPRPRPGVSTITLLPVIAIAVFAAMLFVHDRLGYRGLVVVSGGLVGASLLFLVSFRSPQVALLFWLLSLMGFRELIYIPTPGLPDITLDRLAMLWVSAVFVIKVIGERRRLPRLNPLDALVLAHGLYLLAHMALTNPGTFSIWQRSTLIPHAAYFLGRYLIVEHKWIRACFWVLVLLNVYYAVTSIAEKFGWDALVWPKYILDRTIGMPVPGRSRGIFMQSAVFGTVIGMLMCCQLYLAAAARSRFVRFFSYATFVLAALGLYFTYTRGSWLSGLLGLVAMAVLGWRAYGPILLRIAAVGAVAGAFGMISIANDPFFKERMENEGTVTGRINTATTAFRMFREHPLFGVGFYRYQELKQEYRETITNVPFFGTIKRSQDDEASLHDIYLGKLAETGIVGFGLQMGVYAAAFLALRRKAWVARTNVGGDRYLLPAIGGIFVGYLVGGAAIDYVYFESVNGLCLFTLGILSSYRDRVEEPSRPGITAAPAASSLA